MVIIVNEWRFDKLKTHANELFSTHSKLHFKYTILQIHMHRLISVFLQNLRVLWLMFFSLVIYKNYDLFILYKILYCYFGFCTITFGSYHNRKIIIVQTFWWQIYFIYKTWTITVMQLHLKSNKKDHLKCFRVNR